VSTSTARAAAAGFPGAAGMVFEGEAERIARGLVETHERLAVDFTHRVLDLPRVPWAALSGRDRAFLTEIARQMLIEGRISAEKVPVRG
jgi:hypothetical protein